MSAWAIRCVWLRYFDVYRKNLLYGIVTTYAEPLLYFLSFGYGLGGIIGSISADGHLVTYRQFILSGILAQSIMFQGFFEAAYGGFVRMYYQRIFKAMATTPITLSEVLWAELLWDATKGTFSAFAILLIGCCLGDFSLKGSILVFPLCFVAAFLFAGFGLLVAAKSKTIEEISYPQYLFIFPMFLFGGIYFPLTALPGWMQKLAWVFPITPVVSLLRTLVLGFHFEPIAVLLLVAWLCFFVWLSRFSMTRRLVK